jgi:hypothetical protein
MKHQSAIRSLAACLLALPLTAQSITPPFPVALEKELAGRASHYTEVSMDKKMLAFASRFLNDKEEDDAEAKRLLEKLEGIYVREYDFDKPGQYTPADLQRVRSQFAGSDWSPMVRERSKTGGEDTDVYIKMVNGKVQGLFVLDAEPKELDLVYIVGSIDPEELTKLDGNFGIPKGVGAHVGKRNSK